MPVPVPRTDAGRNTLALAIPVTMAATGLQATLLYVTLFRIGGGGALTIAAAYTTMARQHPNPIASLPKTHRNLTLITLATVTVGKPEWLLILYALRHTASHIAVLTIQLWPMVMITGLQLLNLRTGRYAPSGPLTAPAEGRGGV